MDDHETTNPTFDHSAAGAPPSFLPLFYLKGKIRSIKFLKGIPDRFWSDLAKMYEAIHNFMEARVPTVGEEGKLPIAVAKSTNVKYDPALLLQPPG